MQSIRAHSANMASKALEVVLKVQVEGGLRPSHEEKNLVAMSWYVAASRTPQQFSQQSKNVRQSNVVTLHGPLRDELGKWLAQLLPVRFWAAHT